MEACSKGDNDKLTATLDAYVDKMDDKTIEDMLAVCAKEGHDHVLRTIFNRLPNNPPQQSLLSSLHDNAVIGGLATYQATTERYPQVRGWDLGHLGDELGVAAYYGHKDLVKYLLDHGAVANDARFMYHPIVPQMIALTKDEDSPSQRTEILQLLREKGATIEGSKDIPSSLN
ncbi:MAG: hypothetical protein M1821_007756 [Bathelium mastoideum]|nr:MAG: hypothetical protein M1821_007756 [Bathelium mastoideum]